jgi:hypothetical protein
VRIKALVATVIGFVALTCIAIPDPALAKGGGHGSGGHACTSRSGSHHASGKAHTTHPRSKAVPGVPRDAHGKIKRDHAARASFQRSHPCPATGKSSGACPGYVVDHVKPLKRGGADKPSNMQWQTREAAKQKDKTE